MNLGKIYSGLFFLLFAIFLFIVAGWVYGLIATGIVLAILAIVFFLWRNGYNEKPAIIVSRIAILASILLILASIVMILDTYINGTRHYDYSIRTCGYCDGTGYKFCDGWGGHLIEDKHYTATEIGSNGFLLFFESAMLLCGMIFGLKDFSPF